MMFGENLFDLLGGGGSGSRRMRHKGSDTVQPLSLTLEDLYRGKVSKLQLTKKVLCQKCDGVGGKNSHSCGRCRGKGMVYVTHQIGPMVQSMQTHCDTCSGEGVIIEEHDKCTKCKGHRLVQEKKYIEVSIEPGMKDGEKIVLSSEGDHEPGLEPGNVILVIKEKEHSIFKRNGNDLWIKKKISLNEALCGCSFVVKHLDGRELLLNSTRGQVIKPDSVLGISGEGMRRKNLRGNLYVTFSVEFPNNYFLNEDDLNLLKKCLPKPSGKSLLPLENAEDVYLNDFDEEKYQRAQNGRSEAYNDDEAEEHGHHGQNVQCPTQ